MVLSVTVAVAPAAATLLAAPDAVRLPAPVDPVAIHRFLSDLGPAEQRDLVANLPGLVGNLDGAPVALRYAANRAAMRAAGTPYAQLDGQFLVFDPHGDGRLAQVFGDLATADRIAVLVPGAGNRADNFHRGVGGRALRSPARQAADLFEAVRRYGSAADRFAVLAWLGYDAPDQLDVTAARQDLAIAGAVALERFVAGLTVIRPQATIAVLGHSYGSTVVGLAARRLARQVTDLAVFGSPGLGASDVAELGSTARIWAGLSTRDTMRRVPGVRVFGLGHGAQPADPSFGARVFATADVVDHDHYLAPGTDSLAALAGIVVAGTDRVTP